MDKHGGSDLRNGRLYEAPTFDPVSETVLDGLTKSRYFGLLSDSDDRPRNSGFPRDVSLLSLGRVFLSHIPDICGYCCEYLRGPA